MSNQEFNDNFIDLNEDQIQKGKEMIALINSSNFNDEEYTDEQLKDIYKSALQYSVFFSEKKFKTLNDKFNSLRAQLEKEEKRNTQLKSQLQQQQ
ncbi:hypothetical protein KM1_000520 [Entamoeba histolytica HM-3:IMSS]|uniref:Coiled-coil protein n=2 Tax=Entamoeba histolytica TaxID=5759 RepID=A0A175JD68_ENTHI|nr:hypothetical protein KM1_000520 [Entamoeba histolytica HM-3:IMSS]GAT91424.1 coiled-coil protein [Entamoeba histolytica]